jgi:hypothetical protein
MRQLSVVAACVMLFPASLVSAASVGINFREGDATTRLGQQLAPTEVAGFNPVEQSNWNDVFASATQGFNPVDDTGTATAATVNWGVSNAWGDGSVDESDPTNTPDEKLARGNFDDGDGVGGAAGFGAPGDGFGASIQVTGVPYSDYSVLLYLTSDFGADGEFGVYTVNGATKKGAATLGFADYGDWIPGQNLLVFTGNSSSTLEVFGPARDGGIRGSLAAVQIVEGFVIPEASSAMLLAMAWILSATGFGRYRRRSSSALR